MIKQFCVYEYETYPILIITNTIFNDVEGLLVAPLKIMGTSNCISKLQIPVNFDNQNYYVDLLDLATVSKKKINQNIEVNLQSYREQIKSGIDLLIDGF